MEGAQTNSAIQKKAGVFTRESPEAIQSPEKLNEYIRAVTPGTWILIAALALVMIALIVWGFWGSVPVYFSVRGVGISQNTDQAVTYRQERQFSGTDIVTTVFCPVTAAGDVTAASLDAKQARVVFRDGHAFTGTTQLFDSVPHSREEVERYLSQYVLDYSGWFLSQMEDSEYSYILVVHLDEPADLYYWKDVADVSVIVEEVHPASFLFH